MLYFNKIVINILGVCIGASLLFINSKFDFKTKYDQVEIYVRSMQRNGFGEYGDSEDAIMVPLVEDLKMKESVGSPLIFGALSIGSLLIAVLLSFVEYCLFKKSGEDVQYETMKLS